MQDNKDNNNVNDIDNKNADNSTDTSTTEKKDEYESGRIEYKGELKFLRTIAKDEGVAETTLRLSLIHI